MVLQEKAPYEAKAAKKKDEYGKLMNAYNKKQVNIHKSISPFKIVLLSVCYMLNLCLLCWQESATDDGDEESDRSKSEVHDEDDEAIGEVFLLIHLFICVGFL